MTTHLYNTKLHSPYTCSWHGRELICFFPLASAKIRTLPSNILVTIYVTWNSQIGFCLKHFLHNAASVWDISVFKSSLCLSNTLHLDKNSLWCTGDAHIQAHREVSGNFIWLLQKLDMCEILKILWCKILWKLNWQISSYNITEEHTKYINTFFITCHEKAWHVTKQIRTFSFSCTSE